MKTINVTFEDKEHQKLTEKKGEQSWHEFILKLIDKDKDKEDEKD